MPQYTDTQREMIRAVILEAYLTGFTVPEILQYLAQKKGIQLERRQIYYYIEEVKAEMREESRVSRAEQLGKAIRRLETLYKKAIASEKDPRFALTVQKELHQILGLVVQQHEHRVKTLEDWLREEDGGGAPAIGESNGQHAPDGLPSTRGEPVIDVETVADTPRPPGTPVESTPVALDAPAGGETVIVAPSPTEDGRPQIEPAEFAAMTHAGLTLAARKSGDDARAVPPADTPGPGVVHSAGAGADAVGQTGGDSSQCADAPSDQRGGMCGVE